MAAASQRAALLDCIGDDSDGDAAIPAWLERHSDVAGLAQVHDFLSEEQQTALLASLRECGWLSQTRNQRMLFGLDDAPVFLQRLSAAVTATLRAHAVVRPELLAPFNQAIVNCYAAGEGICAHVDLAAFGDGIAVVSLMSSVVMTFTHESAASCRVLLRPGSLLSLDGPARYEWTHGIATQPTDEWQGAAIVRGPRVSITLRRMATDVTELSHAA